MATIVSTSVQAERATIEAKYLAALDFVEELPVKPRSDKHLIAADYALNGSIMRAFDVGGSDLLEATHILADAIAVQS